MSLTSRRGTAATVADAVELFGFGKVGEDAGDIVGNFGIVQLGGLAIAAVHDFLKQFPQRILRGRRIGRHGVLLSVRSDGAVQVVDFVLSMRRACGGAGPILSDFRCQAS